MPAYKEGAVPIEPVDRKLFLLFLSRLLRLLSELTSYLWLHGIKESALFVGFKWHDVKVSPIREAGSSDEHYEFHHGRDALVSSIEGFHSVSSHVPAGAPRQ